MSDSGRQAFQACCPTCETDLSQQRVRELYDRGRWPKVVPAAERPAPMDVNDRAIMSSYLDGCYGDVPEPVERILRQFFGSMLKPRPPLGREGEQ